MSPQSEIIEEDELIYDDDGRESGAELEGQ